LISAFKNPFIVELGLLFGLQPAQETKEPNSTSLDGSILFI